MQFEHRVIGKDKAWNKEELEKLIQSGTEEGTYLEYKACAALLQKYEIIDKAGNKRVKSKPTDSIKKEVSKDVSAFANADGGTIIYGIIERNHKPYSLDEGFDPDIISKEWVEQIINSNIERHIEDIQIYPIEIMFNRYVYVVEIPKSPFAPHMAKNSRYYRRYNFQVLPMKDYEVRETLSRGLYPILKMHNPKIFPNRDGTFSVIFKIKNTGRSVAKYFDIIIYFEKKIEFSAPDDSWLDLSGYKPTTKLRWSYERVIHPGLRISTPEIKFKNVPQNNLHLTANLYAEDMEMKIYVWNIDVNDIYDPIISIERKALTKKQ